MGNSEFISIAKIKVLEYANKNSDISHFLCDIYVVWVCKVLQNNKALLATTHSDGMYYEVTYNGDKNELYLDCYKKQENVCFKEIV